MECNSKSGLQKKKESSELQGKAVSQAASQAASPTIDSIQEQLLILQSRVDTLEKQCKPTAIASPPAPLLEGDADADAEAEAEAESFEIDDDLQTLVTFVENGFRIVDIYDENDEDTKYSDYIAWASKIQKEKSKKDFAVVASKGVFRLLEKKK